MITKFRCKVCGEIKTEIWMICDRNCGDDFCQSCRERSKREDSGVWIHHRLCQKCSFPGIGGLHCEMCDEIIDKPEMRCSEHDGNVVRTK